ncbi:MAG: hypothetical protein EOP68_19590 [Sphingomonas sp.]|nr:MAG: hypothetical protein EOP68_19590 [Sphingomonas sp.]
MHGLSGVESRFALQSNPRPHTRQANYCNPWFHLWRNRWHSWIRGRRDLVVVDRRDGLRAANAARPPTGPVARARAFRPDVFARLANARGKCFVGRDFVKPCHHRRDHQRESMMASENKRGNRETKKPKKVVSKTIAAAPSTKDMVSAAIKTAGKKTK